jgi:hypothetical protein
MTSHRKKETIRAVDGEADPPNENGNQNYDLLVAGGRSLQPKILPERLATVEIFEFLLSLPQRDYLVGYYINYDTTHWLRDVPMAKQDRIFTNNKQIFGNYTWWKQYGIMCIPGQFFRVCRVDPKCWPPQPLKDSARTVNEVSGYFRGPYLDTLAALQIGTAGEIAEIRAGKEARGQDVLPPETKLRYCKLECRLLAKFATKLRHLFDDCGLPQRELRGAGAAATAILNRQPQIPQRPKKPTRPARIDVAHEEHRYPDDSRWRMAVMTALSGGRIEAGGTGWFDGPVNVYDRHGSYPADLRELPCPRHTNWVKFRGEPKGWRWYLAQGSWAAPAGERIKWGPLPTRTAAQSIIYPSSVNGWWWSPELENLEGFAFKGGWGADKDCDCQPYAFIDELYDQRLLLSDMAGTPIKLGMAAIIGKHAQSRHPIAARWRDLIIAGLTYSKTRRAMRDVMDDDTLMVATDAIYTTKLLAVKQTPALGDWHMTELKNGLFITQPGIFCTPDLTTIRARGFSKSFFSEHGEKLRAVWDAWNPLLPPPSYTVPVEMFFGYKAAQAWQKPQWLGTWQKMEIPLSFDWQPRRNAAFELHKNHVVTFAPDRHQKSVPYDPSAISEMERRDALLSEQPDG